MSPRKEANGGAAGDELEDPTFYVGLGSAVKELREQHGLSRKSLATRSGVSYPYLSEIETGKKRMSARALLLVSRGLDVKPYELLEAAERWISGEQPRARDQMDAKDIIAEIIRGLADLGFGDLVAVREVVNRFAIR
jgi:transcriptional regulator with XRE-family HTH domain